MIEIPFTFMLKQGLHARPASVLADAARRITQTVTLIKISSGERADAKSVLALVAMDVQLNDDCLLVIGIASAATVDLPSVFEENPDAVGTLRNVLNARFGEVENAQGTTQAYELDAATSVPEGVRELGGRCIVGKAGARGWCEGFATVWGTIGLPDETSLAEAGTVPDELNAYERSHAEVLLGLSLSAGTNTQGRNTHDSSAISDELRKAYRTILQDPELGGMIRSAIENGASAAKAVCSATRTLANRLRNTKSEYIRERAADVEDLGSQIVRSLLGDRFAVTRPALTRPTVIVAESLTPSEVLELSGGPDRTHVRGFVLGAIGPTSHAMIVARAMGVPVLTHTRAIGSQAGNGLFGVRDGELIALDAANGIGVLSPSEDLRRYMQIDHRVAARLSERRTQVTNAKTTSEANVAAKLEIGANVGGLQELDIAIAAGAEGVGLFRSELLFFDRSEPPTEEEQFAVYRSASEKLLQSTGSLIIRTLDIGGDKPIPYLNLPKEENPFMGARGVRLYRALRALIREQLRAICRASAFGSIKVMAPMVATLAEAKEFVELLRTVQAELAAEGAAFDRSMPVGVMIEVPSAVLIVDQLASVVDFFSIGTNDLTQYLLAADRGNPAVSGLNDPFNPSLVRALKLIAEQCRTNAHGRRWLGVCGEMAADPEALPLFVGLGVDEISMSAHAIPEIRRRLATLDPASCVRITLSLASAASSTEIREALAGAAAAHGSLSPIDPSLVFLQSESRTKAEVLREVAAIMATTGRGKQAAQIESTLWARERKYSTGLGHGFAIPHCKDLSVLATSIVVLRMQTPIDWGETTDDGKVGMVISLPVGGNAEDRAHMQLLARLARKLMHPDFRDSLLNAKDENVVLSALAAALEIAPSASTLASV